MQIESIALADIDRADRAFQCRVDPKDGGLLESLRRDGQQVAVTLWGERPSYKIVDGHRRVDAIAQLGGDSVMAIVRNDLDEPGVFALSFTENVRRQNFSPLDKANAIWVAMYRRGMSRQEVAESFALSDRQISRYLSLLALDDDLQRAVTSGEISMAHAAVVQRASVDDVPALVKRIVAEDLSVDDVRRAVRVQRTVGRPKSYVLAEGSGFRMRGFRYHAGLSAREKKRIFEALDRAIHLVARSM